MARNSRLMGQREGREPLQTENNGHAVCEIQMATCEGLWQAGLQNTSAMLVHSEAELHFPGSGCLGVVLVKGALHYLLRV